MAAEREDCIFCRIADGKIKSDLLYHDDSVIAFRDIHPIAPVHVLIVPRKHISSVSDLRENEASLIGAMVNVANKLALSEGVGETGYRLVINAGPWGGQAIAHLHMHLLGGRQLGSKLG